MWTENERLRWRILALLAALDTVLLAFGSMSIGWDQLIVAGAVLPLLVLGLVYRLKRPDERLAAGPIAIAQLVLYSNILLLLNYLSTGLERPLIDAALMHWDQALGFYWPDLFRAVFKVDWMVSVLAVAYNSSQIQIAILVLALSLTSRFGHLDRFLLAFMVSGIMTIAFWAPYPSFGAAAYLHMIGTTHGLPDLAKVFGYIGPQLGLHAGELKHLSLDTITGIVAFPSFHTVMALLTIYAAYPLRFLFWPVVAWNALVILAVPPLGGHFVVDVFGGMVVAWAAVAVAERWLAATGERDAHPARTAGSPSALGSL